MEIISGPRTRVLLALVAEHEEHARADVRGVARRAGRSIAWTHQALRYLRDDGLVEWEPGLKGTLRPAVRRMGFSPRRKV